MSQNAANIGNCSHRDRQKHKEKDFDHFREWLVDCMSIR